MDLYLWYKLISLDANILYRKYTNSTARHGTARHGTARHGTARHGTTRHGTAQHSTTRYGTTPRAEHHSTAKFATFLPHYWPRNLWNLLIPLSPPVTADATGKTLGATIELPQKFQNSRMTEPNIPPDRIVKRRFIKGDDYENVLWYQDLT